MDDPEKPVDQRGRLLERPFDYQLAKDGRLLISFQGRLVTTLAGTRAQKTFARLKNADEDQVQLELARVTGNFKRGNEHLAKP